MYPLVCMHTVCTYVPVCILTCTYLSTNMCACQESHREDVLVSRMLRQCQQEQRIATQLMQVRKEKENIRNNRIELQRQFEERRQNDFEEYLKRQSVSHCAHCTVLEPSCTHHTFVYMHTYIYLRTCIRTYMCNVHVRK